MNLIPWHSKQTAADGAGSGTLDVRREIARAMDRFFEEPMFGSRWMPDFPLLGREFGAFVPAVDVTEDDNEIVVRAEIPGIDPDKVDVSISGNSLLLSGQKDESYEDRGKDYYRSERRFGSFRRRIDLPESVDADRITAEYDAGVLSVRAPKRQGAGSKKIPISTASSPRRRGS